MKATVSHPSLVFVDAAVTDYQVLANAVVPGTEVIVLDPEKDGVEQITAVLATRRGIEHLHIISHGQSGCINLGTTDLTVSGLDTYARSLQNWATALMANANILLYGCRVAAGEYGKEFVERLSQLTGASVAASTNLTGYGALGGDWILEFATGPIHAEPVLQPAVMDTYRSVLLNNVLRLTNAVKDQASSVFFTSSVGSSSGLSVTFDFYAYGGTGADGTSFFLVDGSKTPTRAGAFGGSLGYAQRVDKNQITPGLEGGYIGIGFDEFGNYSSGTGGRVEGPGFTPNAIAIRGSEANQYRYLTGTGSLPINLDNPGATATQENSKRRAKIDLAPDGMLSVQVDLNLDGDFDDLGEKPITNFDVDAVNGPLPSTFKFGFAATTGNRTNIHEVGNFDVRTFDGSPIPGFFVDNLVLIGGGGNDNLSGDTGDDTVDSGDGDDTVSAGQGNDTVSGGIGNDTLAGDDGNDTVFGGDGGDTVTGGNGDDTLVGNAGNDTLIGDVGNDNLVGDIGDDILTGGLGNDLLVGGVGFDVLTGGAGSDRFYFEGATKAAALRSSTLRELDRITDFNFAEGDRIVLNFDNNRTTIELPKRLYFSGSIKTKGTLARRVKTAYTSDKLPRKLGLQSLRPNEGMFFRVGQRTFLTVNDARAPFSPTNDLLVEVTGIQFKPGDTRLGALNVNNYFA